VLATVPPGEYRVVLTVGGRDYTQTAIVTEAGAVRGHAAFHLCEHIACARCRKPGLVAGGRQDRHAIPPLEVDVERFQGRRGQIEAEDPADLEQIEHAGHARPVPCKSLQGLAIDVVGGIARVAEVDDEETGVDEDHRRPRLASSASRQEANRGSERSSSASTWAQASSNGAADAGAVSPGRSGSMVPSGLPRNVSRMLRPRAW
jgi:hypothetical protein